jgi:hypothetical protein
LFWGFAYFASKNILKLILTKVTCKPKLLGSFFRNLEHVLMVLSSFFRNLEYVLMVLEIIIDKIWLREDNLYCVFYKLFDIDQLLSHVWIYTKIISGVKKFKHYILKKNYLF